MIIAPDTETNGLDHHHGCQPYYVTVCNDREIDPVDFFEWDVSPFTRKPLVPKDDIGELIKRFEEADLIVFQNAKFDCAAFSTIGVEWKEEWWDKTHDLLYSGHLLASGEPHDLTYYALRYLGVDIKPFEDNLERMVKECQKIVKREFPKWKLAKEGDPMLPSAKSSKGKAEGKLWKYDMWLPRAIASTKKLPKEHEYWTGCQQYSNTDSSVTLPVWKVHERLLKERGLWEIYLERIKLVRVIYSMEKRGVTYSQKRLEEMSQRFTLEAEESSRVCLSLGGGTLTKLPDSGTSKEMKKLLFEEWKLPVVDRSEKTGEPSVDKHVLESWEQSLPKGSKQHTFVRYLRRKRKRDTGVGYMEAYTRFGLPTNQPEFRVLHPSLNSTGSNTLRFTSSNPNEQNISKQAEEDGTSIRTCFGPGPGREWWSIDFKNLELVLPAYYAGEQVMIDLFERPNDPPYFGSYHLLNASIVYEDEFQECLEKGWKFKDKYASTLYQWVKNGGFAKQYGAMEGTDKRDSTVDIAMHKKGAYKLIDASLTQISRLNRECIDFANEHGYVTTIPDKEFGIGYPLECPINRWGKVLATVPLNYKIQGTAMWCTCRSMVRVHGYLEKLRREEGYDGFITLQVHDEIVVDLPITSLERSKVVAREVKRLMELSGDDLGIPISTDVSYHPNDWGSKVKVEL